MNLRQMTAVRPGEVLSYVDAFSVDLPKEPI